MEYQATAKYIRMSPRKVRLVADAIRRMKVTDALIKLKSTSKHAAGPMVDVINAALAAAKMKQAPLELLTIEAIDVQGGPVLKRWHAASRGMAHGYKKRMTHIKVILADGQAKELVSSVDIKSNKNK